MFFSNKIFIFLFCSTYLFAQPIRLSENTHPMAKFGSNAEHLSSFKTRDTDSLNCTLVGGIFLEAISSIFVVDTLLYATSGPYLTIFNVKDSTNPLIAGKIKLPNYLALDVYVQDTLAYVADLSAGLRIVNVSDPFYPVEIGFYDTLNSAYGVWVQDTFAYAACDSGLRIINVADPTSTNETGLHYTTSFGRIKNVWVQDTFAYIASSAGLRIINVANPIAPSEVGFYDSLNLFVNAIYIKDTIAYLGFNEGLSIVNISNPLSPSGIGSYELPDNDYEVSDLWVQDTLAYLAVSSGLFGADSCRLHIVNVSNPSSPSDIGLYLTHGRARAVCAKDNLAYVGYFAHSSYYLDGLLILDITDPSLPLETGKYESGNRYQNMFVKDSLAYVANGYEGLSIINIIDPFSPLEIGLYNTPYYAYDIFIQDTFAYVSDVDSGLRILNITNPDTPSETGFCYTPGQATALWVQDTFAYSVVYDSGLCVINVSDPSSPFEAGFYPVPGNAAWVQDTLAYYVGDSGFSIINIKDPTSINEIGSCNTIGNNVYIQDTLAFIAGLSLRIVNIADLTLPSEIGYYHTPGYPNNVYVQDGLAYIADNYGGLRIINVTDPSSPSQTGFYLFDEEETFIRDVYVKDTLIYACDSRIGFCIFKYTGPPAGIEELSTEKTTFNISSISSTIEINYSIANNEEKVKIEIFNILGQKVGCPVNEIKDRGNYTLNWSGKTGIYFVRTEVGEKVYKKKTLLLR